MLNGPYILLSCPLLCTGKHFQLHMVHSLPTLGYKKAHMHCKFCTLNVIPTHIMSTGKAVIQRMKGKWQSTVGRSLLIRFFIVTHLELRPSYMATPVLLRIVLCFIVLDKAVFLNSSGNFTDVESSYTPTPFLVFWPHPNPKIWLNCATLWYHMLSFQDSLKGGKLLINNLLLTCQDNTV